MKKRIGVQEAIFTALSIIIYIISMLFDSKNNDLVVKILIHLINIVSIVINQDLFSKGYKENIYFMKWVYKMPAFVVFLLLSFFGSASIIFRIAMGGFYRFHHIINNVLILPFTLAALLNYVKRIDNESNMVEYVNLLKGNIIIKVSPILLQGILFYIMSLELSYDRVWLQITVADYVITSDGINKVFLLIVFFLFMLSFIYIITFFFTKKELSFYFFKEMFPTIPVTGVTLFYVFWGVMALYETENRIEATYYISIFLIALAIVVLSIIFWLKLNTYGGGWYFFYNIAISLALMIYGTVIYYLESIGYSAILMEEKESTLYSILTILILMIIVVIVVLVMLMPMLDEKFKRDKRNYEKKA